MIKAILFMGGGCVAVICGLVASKFYAADICGGSISDKPLLAAGR